AEDTVLESDETFTLSVGEQTATGTIVNDDAVPTINDIADVSEEEGDALAFAVTLSNTADTAQTFEFSLTNGTTDSSDYGNVTFSEGVTLNDDGTITVDAGVAGFTVTVA
ncbi:cadherin repeat domain-containing protein, partial [Vibrio sp. 10N.261.52.C11]